MLRRVKRRGLGELYLHTKPRKATLPAAALLGFSCLLTIGLPAAVRAQEPAAAAAATTPAAQERERGADLYSQGKVKEAIKALRAAVKLDQNDAEAWHLLSLALHRYGDAKEARKAVEKAIKLRPDYAPSRAGLAYLLLLSNKQRDALREAEAALALDPPNAEAHYVASVVHLRQEEPDKALDDIKAALSTKPDFAAALLWKSQVLINLYSQPAEAAPDESPEALAKRAQSKAELLKEATESLEKYFQLNPEPKNEAVWREQLETLRGFSRSLKMGGAGTDQTVYLPGQLTTKARLLSRPEPQYTEEARRAQVSGTVVLRAVFSADGTVQRVLVARSLPHGLTEAAVRAARRIKFVPATRDGRPVSQFIQIEYNFNLY